MSTPFHIDGPAVISFSGGRTSGLMLRHILDAHGGTLPADVHVLFANTGKERAETLAFVHAIETRWAVPIHWIERRKNSELVSVAGKARRQRTDPDGPMFVERDFATASREGEPYLELLSEREYLPNPVTRFCTTELKIRPMRDWMRAHGYADEVWTNVVGLRADEQRRVAKRKERSAEGSWSVAFPLHSAGLTLQAVTAFWRSSPFDLQLQPWEGNCDLCFLKGQNKIVRIMEDRPDLAEWWLKRELEHRGARSPRAALFRTDRPSYAALFNVATHQLRLVGQDDPLCRSLDELDDCACTD